MRKLLFIVICLFSIFILVSCKDEKPLDNEEKENNTEEPKEEPNENTKPGTLFIHYVFNDGRQDLIEEINSIDEYEIIEPERTGYVFDGWYVDQEFDVELELSMISKPTGIDDITIMAYADWHVAQFMVKFMRDGYLMMTQLVKYGESAREPNVPIKAGYRFVGWDKDISCITEETIANAVYVENNESKNIMVVLGNWMNNDGTISNTMRTRLELALKAYSEFKFDYIVVTGGMANAQAGISEAQAMYDYLVSHGIDKNIIIKEDQSMSTEQNAIYTMRKLEDIDFKNLVIVSTIEHFVNYQTIKYFNDAARNNAKVRIKMINIMIYTNNGVY